MTFDRGFRAVRVVVRHILGRAYHFIARAVDSIENPDPLKMIARADREEARGLQLQTVDALKYRRLKEGE